MCKQMTWYAVVYGDNWEDIEYFSSYKKACVKLVVQTLGMTSFHPFMMEYADGDHGTMERTKNMMAIQDLQAFNELDKTAIKLNPESAFDYIRSIF